MSSSLETDTEIGYKDHQKIKKFINTINELKIKGIPLIDQHDKYFMWWKVWSNFIPETLKKPIDDLTKLFQNLEMKKFLKERDYYFKNYIGVHTIYKT